MENGECEIIVHEITIAISSSKCTELTTITIWMRQCKHPSGTYETTMSWFIGLDLLIPYNLPCYRHRLMSHNWVHRHWRRIQRAADDLHSCCLWRMRQLRSRRMHCADLTIPSPRCRMIMLIGLSCRFVSVWYFSRSCLSCPRLWSNHPMFRFSPFLK